MSNPLFVGLGFQKCATTWLSQRLRLHPDVYVPPINELRFWDSFEKGQALPFQNLYVKRSAERLAEETDRERACRIVDRLVYWRHYQGVRTDGFESYVRLFEPGRDARLAGEISPGYAGLSEETLWLIANGDDRTRVFLLMREPISRLWSQIRHHARRTPEIVATPQAMCEFLETDVVRVQANYDQAIRRLQQVFPKERVGYFFFEDMLADQEAYLRSICTFLGVSFIPRLVLREEREPGSSDKMPPDVQVRARELYGHVAANVESLVGRVPGKWRKA
jgi:hypothetical protein